MILTALAPEPAAALAPKPPAAKATAKAPTLAWISEFIVAVTEMFAPEAFPEDKETQLP